MPPPLSPRHRIVVDAYFSNGFKEPEAVLAAGYDSASAPTIFKHPAIVAEIERRMNIVTARSTSTAELVTEQLYNIANGGNTLAKFKKVQHDGTIMHDFTGATEAELALITTLDVETYMDGKGEDAREVKKFKVSYTEPKGALDSLARIHGLFKDKVEVQHSVTERLMAGRDRVRKLNAPQEAESDVGD